jgi:two-component system LytT family response regulator
MVEAPVRTVIADDEPLARARLAALLEPVEWIQLVGEARDGPDVVALVNEARPDLVFLDVVMPGLTGLEAVERFAHHPTIVFTTAFDRFAVAAFEARAVDYLLKPFGRRRLDETLTRVRSIIQAEPDPSATERQRAALRPGNPLDWLFIREHGRVTPIDVNEIIRFEGRDDYVAVHTAGRRRLASLKMADLEQLLPASFVRIHRSHIVNLAHVESFLPDEGGRYQVLLRDGTTVAVSRARSQWIRERAV